MLLVTDLHLTDKEADRYRWEIFTWIYEYFESTGDKNILILGDLTDSKDHHSANLVNAVVKRCLDLTEAGMELFILKGNHDYIDPDLPYFEFLENFEWINYIRDPKCFIIEGRHCLFLPHSRNPVEEWAEDHIVEKYRKKCDLVFMHESVIGSVTSNGYEMEKGLPTSYFRRFEGRIFSGDIHCPQQVGRITYVGTPYSIRFNDHFRGRAIAIGTDLIATPFYPDIRGRWTFEIDSPKQLTVTNASFGDQIKVRYRLAEGQEGDWDGIRKHIYKVCKRVGLEVCGIQIVRPDKLPLRGKKHKAAEQTEMRPVAVVDRFVKQKGISKGKHKAGRRLLEE